MWCLDVMWRMGTTSSLEDDDERDTVYHIPQLPDSLHILT